MKHKITITLFALLVITACRNKTTDATTIQDKDVTKIEIKTSNNSEPIKDCDDFLDTYESWTTNLIALMAKYKDDPMRLASSPEYTNTMMEGMNFIQDWNTIATSCASQPSYETRMKAIQRKIEDKQKELGLKD